MASVPRAGFQSQKPHVQQSTSEHSATDELSASAKNLPLLPKTEANPPGLDLGEPHRIALLPSSDISSNSLTTLADNDEDRAHCLLITQSSGRGPWRSPLPPIGLRGKATTFWAKNKGLALVILAQLFGIMMNVTTRLLELDGRHGTALHPFQVSSTSVVACQQFIF